MHDGKDRGTVVTERQTHAEDRKLQDEVVRAVKGIRVPDPFTGRAVRSRLLCQDLVMRECLEDAVDNESLRCEVDFRYEISARALDPCRHDSTEPRTS